MSKKLAGGAARLVLDVKVGAGAFLPDREAAPAAADADGRAGGGLGPQRDATLLTAMDAAARADGGQRPGGAPRPARCCAARGPARPGELAVRAGRAAGRGGRRGARRGRAGGGRARALDDGTRARSGRALGGGAGRRPGGLDASRDRLPSAPLRLPVVAAGSGAVAASTPAAWGRRRAGWAPAGCTRPVDRPGRRRRAARRRSATRSRRASRWPIVHARDASWATARSRWSARPSRVVDGPVAAPPARAGGGLACRSCPRSRRSAASWPSGSPAGRSPGRGARRQLVAARGPPEAFAEAVAGPADRGGRPPRQVPAAGARLGRHAGDPPAHDRAAVLAAPGAAGAEPAPPARALRPRRRQHARLLRPAPVRPRLGRAGGPAGPDAYWAARAGVEPLDPRLHGPPPRELLGAAPGRRSRPCCSTRRLVAGHRQHLRGRGAVPAPGSTRCGRPARSTQTELRRLHRAIRDRLAAAVEAGGASIDRYRDTLGERGRCRTCCACTCTAASPARAAAPTILKTRVAQRGTYWCPRCQPEPARGDRVAGVRVGHWTDAGRRHRLHGGDAPAGHGRRRRRPRRRPRHRARRTCCRRWRRCRR